MKNISLDIRHGLRRLRLAPAFTLFAIITLALGIGATTAIYSAISSLFTPPNISDIDRVVNIYHMKPPGSGPMVWMSWPDYQDLKAQQTHLGPIAAWTLFREAIVGEGPTERIVGEVVGGDYFALVGARPELGRLLQPDDDQPNAAAAAVISHAFWQRWFSADPSVIGHTVRIGNQVVEIVGVVESGFSGVNQPGVLPTPVWISTALGFRMDSTLARRATEREARQFSIKGRLKPDSTIEDVRKEIDVIAGRLDLDIPIGRDRDTRSRMPYATSRKWYVMPASAVRLNEGADFYIVPMANALLLAVGLVLLVACTNLANLTLARASRRRHETAVRMAIGATRWRLVREQVIEGAFMASAGGLLSFVVAHYLLIVLSKPIRMGPGTIIQLAPRLNASAFAVTIASTILTLLVFSLVPALRTTKHALSAALNADNGTVSLRWRGRHRLIATQVMVSTVLVSLAFMCAQQVIVVSQQDFGVDLDRLATAQIDFRVSGYDESRARAVMSEALRSVRARPGVEGAAIASSIPLAAQTRGAYLASEGTPTAPNDRIYGRLITGTPEMFAVLGTRVRIGRGFDENDRFGTEPVAVISENVARRVFGTTDAVGRRMQMQRQRSVAESEFPNLTMTIVGVVAEPNGKALGLRTEGYVFRPWEQEYESTVGIVVRTSADPSSLVSALSRTIHDVDSNAIILDATTGAAASGADALTPKIMGAISGLLGGLALVLSLAGLYGILSYMVAGRSREMGLRMALGAGHSRIMLMILRDGLQPVASGLAAGLLITIGLRVFAGPVIMTFFPTLHPVIFALVPVPFLAATVAACYFPARRAASVDPMNVLRDL